MRKLFVMAMCGLAVCGLASCGGGEQKAKTEESAQQPWTLEQFADLRIMRYEIPGWDSLTPQQRVLCYYLSEAALCGRDIIYDQNGADNLTIRRLLEAMYLANREKESGEEWDNFVVYLKRVWFANGIHHHYAMTKFTPNFSTSYFRKLVATTPVGTLPEEIRDTTKLFAYAMPVIYDSLYAAKRVNKAADQDLLLTSAMNYYRGVSQAEAEAFEAGLRAADQSGKLPVGMNSQLVKVDGKLQERVWKVGGMYTQAIEKIVYWLRKAQEVAETPEQAKSIGELIRYYETGDLSTFNDYCIAWVNDTAAQVDFVNGFIEDYGDPLGVKCSWESIVNFKDMAATHRMETLSANAQWFEDNSPVDAKYKKKEVKGVTAKVINAVQLAGDCYPSTPIGINLPNANWIRKEHGSKSVTIENITYAYDKAAEGNGFLEEFAYSPEEVERSRQYGCLSSNVHTDLHECLGHASGQLMPNVSGGALKNYSATLEEARADLFALYYIMDPKLVELGILPSLEYAKAEYDSYIRNGLLTQLTRIKPGEEIEEDHMRNRALIAQWVYEKGQDKNVVKFEKRDGKTFVTITDYDALRGLFGDLLAEVQRVKSEGDFEAGKALVERYGVKVDPQLHAEVLSRYEGLHLAPYGGFVNPRIEPVYEGEKIVDAKVVYGESYAEQMLRYSRDYSFLPDRN